MTWHQAQRKQEVRRAVVVDTKKELIVEVPTSLADQEMSQRQTGFILNEESSQINNPNGTKLHDTRGTSPTMFLSLRHLKTVLFEPSNNPGTAPCQIGWYATRMNKRQVKHGDF